MREGYWWRVGEVEHLFCFAGEAVRMAASGSDCPVGPCIKSALDCLK